MALAGENDGEQRYRMDLALHMMPTAVVATAMPTAAMAPAAVVAVLG